MIKKVLFLLLFSIALCAGAIERGDTRESVLTELGKPKGNMIQGDVETLLFSKGTVTLQNGIVIESDISEKNLQRAQERTALAAQRQKEREEKTRKQKQLYPEDKFSVIACRYEKNEDWSYLPELIRPTEGDNGYLLYLPMGYYESEKRYYPCLFVERPALWEAVQDRVREEKWVAVVLSDQTDDQLGRKMNGNFLAAYDNATDRFRISRHKLFTVGNVPSLLYATMRPIAGVILQEPDFDGLRKLSPPVDLLRKTPDLRVYSFFEAQDENNLKKQAQFITTNIPKYHINTYDGYTKILPVNLADLALDWMKKEYRLP